MFYIGVDAAKGKWLAIKLSDDGTWEVRLFDTIKEIWDRFSYAESILIDMPIGLREGGSEGRLCDNIARGLLGPRRSSVFSVPCRATLEAKNYEEAKKISIAKTGKSITIQSWSIIPKIREIDEFLNGNASAKVKIREIHPEVCFWALNGGKPMELNKKKGGFDERRRVLRRLFRHTDKVILLAKSELIGIVADDDILDALVAAVTAYFGNGRLKALPERPEIDSRGLPMEMVYYPVL
jgi:predicted RNase H-like nuclease